MTSQSTTERAGASVEAIRFHYDVSNDFYALWLDPEMVYSSALWTDDPQHPDTLQCAQVRKIVWHLDNCKLERGQRVLDIGCGWGAVLKYALDKYGVKSALGLTLSAEQVKWVDNLRIPGLEVRLESWRDHSSDQPYDGIISIGAFEHFARLDQSSEDKIKGYREFFEFCYKHLKPAGRMSLQTIVYQESRREDFSEFFANHVFPESDLPSICDILASSSGLFEVELLHNHRKHYERTLKAWLHNLRTRRDEAVAVVGESTVAKYEKYMRLMVVAFHTGATNLTRVVLRRVADRHDDPQ